MANLKPHKTHQLWKDTDKLRAVRVFKSLANLTKTGEITGIPHRTLSFWQTQEWWKEQLNALRAEDSAELEEAATSIAKQASDIVKERLTNGDFVFNRDGEMVRKPVSARDANLINAINIDKRKILQEEPQRASQLGSDERLLKLFEQFARFTNSKEIKGVVNDSKNEKRISSEIIVGGQEPIEAEPEQTGSTSQTPPSGLFQAEETLSRDAIQSEL